MMQSKLFSRVDPSRDDTFKKDTFSRDLAALLQIPEDKTAVFLEFMSKRLMPSRDSEVRALEEQYAGKLGVEVSVLTNAYDVAYWFTGRFVPKKEAERDTAQDIAGDLIALDICTEDKRQHIESLLQGFKDLIQTKLLMELRKTASLGKCMPKLKGASSVVSFHALFERELDFGDSAEGYSPNCLGVTPIIEFSLTLSDSPKKVCFEADVAMVENLAQTLDAALAEFRSASTFLNLEQAEQTKVKQ